MSIEFNPCLSTIFEFLSLSEKSGVARVSRHWHSMSRNSFCGIIDTIGFDIGVDAILNLLVKNRTTATIIRVSLRERDLEKFFTHMINIVPQMHQLEELCVLASSPNGSVFVPQELHQMDRHKKLRPFTSDKNLSFLIQYDPGNFVSVQKFISVFGPQLSVLGFLRGCAEYLPSTSAMSDFLESINPRILHLGDCSANVDWDELVPGMIAQKKIVQYFQWRNASASIETMQLAMRYIPICDFDCMSYFLAFPARNLSDSREILIN